MTKNGLLRAQYYFSRRVCPMLLVAFLFFGTVRCVVATHTFLTPEFTNAPLSDTGKS